MSILIFVFFLFFRWNRNTLGVLQRWQRILSRISSKQKLVSAKLVNQSVKQKQHHKKKPRTRFLVRASTQKVLKSVVRNNIETKFYYSCIRKMSTFCVQFMRLLLANTTLLTLCCFSLHDRMCVYQTIFFFKFEKNRGQNLRMYVCMYVSCSKSDFTL